VDLSLFSGWLDFGFLIFDTGLARMFCRCQQVIFLLYNLDY
jgi:hypothetical protein